MIVTTSSLQDRRLVNQDCIAQIDVEIVKKCVYDINYVLKMGCVLNAGEKWTIPFRSTKIKQVQSTVQNVRCISVEGINKKKNEEIS